MMNTITFDNKTYSPSKIVCVGLNFVDHIEELNNQRPTEPVIFCKPNSSIAEEIRFHPGELIHYETELSFLVLNQQLAGVGIGFDLTKRDLQSQLRAQGHPWERSKAFDGAAVFSQFIPLNDGLSELTIQLHINNKLVQDGGYDLMIFKPEYLLQYVGDFMSWCDGDILMSGTPKGVGAFQQGDVFKAQIHAGDDCLLQQSWQVK